MAFGAMRSLTVRRRILQSDSPSRAGSRRGWRQARRRRSSRSGGRGRDEPSYPTRRISNRTQEPCQDTADFQSNPGPQPSGKLGSVGRRRTDRPIGKFPGIRLLPLQTAERMGMYLGINNPAFQGWDSARLPPADRSTDERPDPARIAPTPPTWAGKLPWTSSVTSRRRRRLGGRARSRNFGTMYPGESFADRSTSFRASVRSPGDRAIGGVPEVGSAAVGRTVGNA